MRTFPNLTFGLDLGWVCCTSWTIPVGMGHTIAQLGRTGAPEAPLVAVPGVLLPGLGAQVPGYLAQAIQVVHVPGQCRQGHHWDPWVGTGEPAGQARLMGDGLDPLGVQVQ